MNPLVPPSHLDAQKILQTSKSNFAPAFQLLAPAAREDLAILYAVCRLVDDVADNESFDLTSRREALDAWRTGFLHPEGYGLPDNLYELMLRRAMPLAHFLELLEGATTDLAACVRMSTRADLNRYCYCVAGTVGLLCLPIFEAESTRCSEYAKTLGRALQFTNILRDAASDLQRDRIYFPLDELSKGGLTPENFLSEHALRQRYLEQFAMETENLFTKAASLLPTEDRHALQAARVMAALYARLLRKMRRDKLRVMEKRYRLTTAEKLRLVAAELLSNRL